jgi:hypothetical protein
MASVLSCILRYAKSKVGVLGLTFTVMYTTNAVESINSSFRKVTKKGRFLMNPESVICPYKQFYAIAIVIAKCKNYFIPLVKLKLLTYDF